MFEGQSTLPWWAIMLVVIGSITVFLVSSHFAILAFRTQHYKKVEGFQQLPL
jgi:hypothetical protein